MKKKLSVACMALIVLCACESRNPGDMEKINWLLGTWASETPEGYVYETWSRNGETEFAGKSYSVNEQDTTVYETIRLVKEESGLSYIPTIKDENNGMPVRFACTTVSETRIVFENPQHDFPQIISYTLVNNDSLVAEIAGTPEGKVEKQTFAMKRVR